MASDLLIQMPQIRGCDYRNHYISMPRCINKGITSVSIRLKTIKTKKARKIIRNAERDLLQARVKSINSFIDNNNKQRNICMPQLASIV